MSHDAEWWRLLWLLAGAGFVVAWIRHGWRWSGRDGGRRANREESRDDRRAAPRDRDERLEDLERRILELENRQDFTERLVAERSQGRSGPPIDAA